MSVSIFLEQAFQWNQENVNPASADQWMVGCTCNPIHRKVFLSICLFKVLWASEELLCPILFYWSCHAFCVCHRRTHFLNIPWKTEYVHVHFFPLIKLLQDCTFWGVVGCQWRVHFFCLCVCLLCHCIHTHKGEANTSNLIMLNLYLKTVQAVIAMIVNVSYH